MDNREFSNIGEQIRNSVQDAIDSMDYKQLNKTISDTVNTALDETRSRLMKGADALKGQWVQKSEDPGYRPFQTSYKKSRMNQPGRVAGILYTVFGGIGLGIILLLFLAVFIVALAVKPLAGVLMGASVFLLTIGSVFGFMLRTGISIRERLKRARLYRKQAGERLYCPIEELSGNIGKSREYVVKDLQKIIEKGIFPEAHLDKQKTCLILSDTVFKQYLDCQKALEEREKEKERKEESRNEESSGIPVQLEQMMAEGRNYLRILREANEAIPGEAISQKIVRLEDVIRRIFDSVYKHPEQIEEMERFMDYYLPTTVKLVTAYRDFDSAGSQGNNIASAKKEIEDTLDTINHAFEQLLDDLYQDAALDITTDASVLQTMLKNDGWAESEFTGGKKNE